MYIVTLMIMCSLLHVSAVQAAVVRPGRRPIELRGAQVGCWLNQMVHCLAACDSLYFYLAEVHKKDEESIFKELKSFLEQYRSFSSDTTDVLHTLSIKKGLYKVFFQSPPYKTALFDCTQTPLDVLGKVLELFRSDDKLESPFESVRQSSGDLTPQSGTYFTVKIPLAKATLFAEVLKVLELKKYPAILVLNVEYNDRGNVIAEIMSEFTLPNTTIEYVLKAMIMCATDMGVKGKNHYYSLVRYDLKKYYSPVVACDERWLKDERVIGVSETSDLFKGVDCHWAYQNNEIIALLMNGYEKPYKGMLSDAVARPVIFFYERKSVGDSSKAVSDLQEQLSLLQELVK